MTKGGLRRANHETAGIDGGCRAKKNRSGHDKNHRIASTAEQALGDEFAGCGMPDATGFASALWNSCLDRSATKNAGKAGGHWRYLRFIAAADVAVAGGGVSSELGKCSDSTSSSLVPFK